MSVGLLLGEFLALGLAVSFAHGVLPLGVGLWWVFVPAVVALGAVLADGVAVLYPPLLGFIFGPTCRIGGGGCSAGNLFVG